MKSTNDDVRRERFDSHLIEAALHKLKSQAPEVNLETFSLVKFLDEQNILEPAFQENLKKWPEPIQRYINKQLINFVRKEPEFKDEDLQLIGRFFETALQEPEPCQDQQAGIPEQRWNDAMTALAQELRRYYGLEENDTELPCWKLGL